jgi:hypothetical protein
MPRTPRLPFRRRSSAFERNRPVLRSPVMARLDELFADPARNEGIYRALLDASPRHLDPDLVRSLFAEHSPDDTSRVGIPSEAVVTHVFEHILGSGSWWGRAAREWRGTELFAAAYLDAFRRAQRLGNVPVVTFHHLGSTDDRLQLVVLETPGCVVVQVQTPGLPKDVRHYKLEAGDLGKVPAVDAAMPEVGAFTVETLQYR